MALRLPRPLARRDVLYERETPRERLVELGRAYLEQDLVFDAADFFCEAHDREGLELIKARAREMGDAFLLRQVWMAAPELVSGSDWDDLARRAKELGKDLYAERAETGGAPPPPPFQEEEEKIEEEGPGPAAEGAGGSARGRSTKGGARKKHGRGRRRTR